MPTSPDPQTLASIACAALVCDDVDEKLDRVAAASRALAEGDVVAMPYFACCAPQTPGRPPRPELVPPRLLDRRSTASPVAHAALIHAVAHIEFNAINLALDALCRFPELPRAFYVDWLKVAAEEATHFSLLREHLRCLGHDYGDFAAHDGLWQMALKTAHDPLARMALVPRVLEARGLDASPGIIRRLREARDERGAEIIEIILRDEVGHVAIGTRWFNHLCAQRGLDPERTFEALLLEYDAPRPVLPLNVEARRRARFTPGEIEHVEALAKRRAMRPTR
ncbi:MAG: DUF455 family protein [Betaproteobacteria bacterium]|nr:MAG: DUF455 family protein [Betaproteobacteria bacterium]